MNHAIGEDHINGGIRVCSGRPEIIVQSGDGSKVLAVRYEEGQLVPSVLGRNGDEGIWHRALSCGV